MILEAGGQFICVEIGGAVFSVSGGLTFSQWMICLAFGAGEIPWNWLVCMVPEDAVPDALLNFDKKLEVRPQRINRFARRKFYRTRRLALNCSACICCGN